MGLLPIAYSYAEGTDNYMYAKYRFSVSPCTPDDYS